MLLLDEIEKAHPDVFNLLLQVMDHGTLTDNNGRKADFRNVIIVMTTNAGAEEMSRPSIGFTSQDHSSDGMEAINRLFTPEFRNRLDAIIQFKPLTRRSSSTWSTSSSIELEAQLEDKQRDAGNRRRGARVAGRTRLRPEDGRATHGPGDSGAHQATAGRGAAVRQLVNGGHVVIRAEEASWRTRSSERVEVI